MVESAFFFDVDTNSRFTDEISQGYLGQARRKEIKYGSLAHGSVCQSDVVEYCCFSWSALVTSMQLDQFRILTHIYAFQISPYNISQLYRS